MCFSVNTIKFGRHWIHFYLTYNNQVHVFLAAAENITGGTGKHPAVQVLGVRDL